MDMKWIHISDGKLSPKLPQAPMPTILEKILTYLMHQNLIWPHDVLKDAPWKDHLHINQTSDLECLKTTRVDI
jgi:hypothetical protein